MFLVSFCSCLCPIYWSQVLSWEWWCSWSSADRWCSNYIWVINNFIAHLGVPYIRGSTVHRMSGTGCVILMQYRLLTSTLMKVHDDDMAWKGFLHYCPFVRGIHCHMLCGDYQIEWVELGRLSWCNSGPWHQPWGRHMMMARHGSMFCIIGPLWGESIDGGRFPPPHKKALKKMHDDGMTWK